METSAVGDIAFRPSLKECVLDASGLAVLDELWAHGIMVALTVDGARNDLTRVQQVVTFYKNHPAVLMWLLGNEWNINLYYGKAECNTPLKAAQCTEAAAALVKSLDADHPVATNYGEIDINASGLHLADTQNYVSNVCPSVDVWSLNVFRSDNFGTLFDQWRSITTKPMFLGEFGTDALSHPADLPDETMQAGWDLCLWNHAITELSAVQPSLVNLGGTVFEWNDEWWKAPPANAQNVGGFVNVNGHPDGFANEDWFGVTDIARHFRHAATALGGGFGSGYHRPPRGLIFGTGSRGGNAAQYAGQYGYARFYRCGRSFYAKNGGGGGGRGFNAVVLDPVTGSQLQAPQNFDTWGTRQACAQNSPSAALTALSGYLSTAPAGSLILLSVADEAGLNQDLSCNRYSTSACFENGLSALEALGSTRIRSYCFGNSWAMIAVKGQGVVAEGLSSNNLVSLQAPLPDPGSFVLSLDKAGAGTGAVISDPPGLDCGAACATDAASFATGALVALTPTAAPGSVFTGWSGDPDCGNGVVTIDADKSCTARFDLLETLTVTKFGTGSGTVTSAPVGIDCGPDCSEGYAFGISVTLTAAPAAGSRFGGWSGACAGTGSCVVTMTTARSVTATFIQTYSLSVSKAGTGSGTVTSSPTGINCGVDCTEDYDSGISVTLTATPAAGSRFGGWGGACTGTGSCVLTMDAAKSVTATFIQTYTLSVSKAGSGSGTVTSSPIGINCDADCTEVYDSGTSVTLTATPAAGSGFNGWSGACTGTGACVVTIDAAKAVTATFDVLSLILSVSRSGTGSGAVTSSPAGIDCGTDYAESYLFGTSVGLTATPASGSLFTGWTGDCSGSGTCTVTLDAPRTVTATFTAGPINLDFYTVTPCRVLDTRTGSGPITSGGVLVFAVSGSCGIPSDAWAVTLNLTVIGATGNGNVVLFPGNAAPPPTSTINFAAGLTLANNAILALSNDGAGSLAAKAIVAGGGTVHVIVDVNGYFQ